MSAEELAALRLALRIGAVSHDGDAWYATDAGLGDHEEGEQAFKDAFAILDQMEREAGVSVPTEPGAPDPDDALHDPACGRSPGHRDPLCPKCASDYRIAEIVNRNKPNAKRKPPRSVPAPEPSARLRRFLDDVEAENARAKAKFPDAGGSLAALTEEAGELAKAVLSEPPENVYAEAVQVASMAARVALEGDWTLDRYREKVGVAALAATPQDPEA